MAKKSTFLFIVILLIFSNVTFAQTKTAYSNFDPSSLKENAEYAANFAPNTFDEEVLYKCMCDMVNMARAQYSFLPAMKHDENIDSTAQFQADYQASKDEKTEENNSPYHTLGNRLRKYHLAMNGAEIVARTKAYLGAEEYSYYDVCYSIMQSIVNNNKLVEILLDKQYSYLGFGYQTDNLMRNLYVSLVFGNDKTFNKYKAENGERDIPYSRGNGSLKPFDSKICKKAATDPALEVLSDYFSLDLNGDVALNCNDPKGLKKLIGKEGDAIAVDFVQHLQYGCTSGTIDYDLCHRGYTTKPITYEKLLAANESPDPKSGKLIAKVASVPDQVDVDEDMDLHVLVLKEEKYVCRVIIPKKVETKNAAYKEKINYLKDETGIKSKGEWVASTEQGTFSVTFPYDLKKTDYTYTEISQQVNNLNVPKYKVNKIEIIAHNSPYYYKDAAYQKIQTKRMDAFKKSMIAYYPGVEIATSYDYCFEQFKKDINNNQEYYDLAFLSLDECARQLKADYGYIGKTLEADYLSKYYYYEVKYDVTYPIDSKEKEQDFVVWKFNNALTDKNKSLAMSIEDYIIAQIEKGRYSAAPLKKMSIPAKAEYQTLLNNKLYMEYYMASKLTPEISTEMNKVAAMNPANQRLLYNTAVNMVFQSNITSIADITKIQAEIDKLYNIAVIPTEKVNALNMEFQLMILDFLSTQPSNTETNALSTSTYAKIKAIRNPVLDSWQNAYKLASYFAKKYDYVYALQLMDPFLDDKNISDDFIFSYVSMGAHRESTYLSPLYTKAVQLASEKSPARLCGLFDKLPYCVMENEAVREIICKACNR